METYHCVSRCVLFWSGDTFRFSKGRLSLGERECCNQKRCIHENALNIYSVVEHDATGVHRGVMGHGETLEVCITQSKGTRVLL